MTKVTLLSAVLITAASFATPVLAAQTHSRHAVTDAYASTTPMRSFETGACIRAPRVGAFATEPWTNAAPCEPYTGYTGYTGYSDYTGY
jgi:hypothetical protein